MHINVRDFLVESVGYSRSYAIHGERPHLEYVILTSDVEGNVTVAHLEGVSLLAKGVISTEIQLECHRCLRTFTRPVRVSFQQVFADKPTDDEMPILDHEIDLAPVIEQEILVSLPIKILDRPDCPGIIVGQPVSQPAEQTNHSLKSRARIIKEER